MSEPNGGSEWKSPPTDSPAHKRGPRPPIGPTARVLRNHPIGSIFLALVLTATTGLLGYSIVHRSSLQGPLWEATQGGECVGVSDGSETFGAEDNQQDGSTVRDYLDLVWRHNQYVDSLKSAEVRSILLMVDVTSSKNLTSPGACPTPRRLPSPSVSTSASPATGATTDPACGNHVLPSPVQAFDASGPGSVPVELGGALIGVCEQAGNPPRVYGHLPLYVKILVANVGSDFDQAPYVADKVLQRDTSSFLGVTGLNQSRPEVWDAISALAGREPIDLSSTPGAPRGAGMPVLVDKATADNLTGPQRPFSTLFRLVETNANMARYLSDFTTDQRTGRPDADGFTFQNPLGKSRPCIIYSQHNPLPGTSEDTYSTSLEKDISQRFNNSPPLIEMPESSTSGDLLQGRLDNSCGRADSIIYAARADEFPCVIPGIEASHENHLPIIAGDSLSSLDLVVKDTTQNPISSKFSNPDDMGSCTASLPNPDDEAIYYVDNGFTPPPQGSPTDNPSITEYFVELKAMTSDGAPSGGNTAVTFDAVQLLTSAAGTVGANHPNDFIEGGAALWSRMTHLLSSTCGGQAHPGASGIISFDDHGDTPQKLIIIQEWKPTGPKTIDHYGFLDQADFNTYMSTHPVSCQQSSP